MYSNACLMVTATWELFHLICCKILNNSQALPDNRYPKQQLTALNLRQFLPRRQPTSQRFGLNLNLKLSTWSLSTWNMTKGSLLKKTLLQLVKLSNWAGGVRVSASRERSHPQQSMWPPFVDKPVKNLALNLIIAGLEKIWYWCHRVVRSSSNSNFSRCRVGPLSGGASTWRVDYGSSI